MLKEIYYFTGTGNGLHISKSIKKYVKGDYDEIKLIPINTLDLSNEIRSSADTIGIIYPIYSMTSPDIVRRFAEKLRTQSNTYLYLYGHSGGANTQGGMYSILKILEANHIRVSNDYETIFHSSSALIKYDDKQVLEMLDIAEESIQENIKRIGLKEIKRNTTISLSKKTQFAITRNLGSVLESYLQIKKITSNDDCIGCKTCEKICPVENIAIVNGKPSFSDQCQMCLSCVNQCPKKALSFGKMSKDRLLSYRHPNVKLSELVYR